jgi:pimeloyl-ACP methyl ester carboxylesterase
LPEQQTNAEPNVSQLDTLTININGFPARVWRKGNGPKIGFLAGYGGLPKWMPFLEELSKSRTLIVPSLPGFPGGDRGHSVLDSHLDWLLAVRETLAQAGLSGADLVGSSVGASLAAEVAALWPAMVNKLAMIAPFGLFDERNPPTDPWAQRADRIAGLMCADPEIWKSMKSMPSGANSIEWPIEQVRANEAAARVFWPLGNTGIEKRLHLIKSPTLLLWGEHDRVMPLAYAGVFAKHITGPTTIKVIPRAGHLAEHDRPAEVAAEIGAFTDY